MTIEAFYAAVGGDYQSTLRRLMVPEIVETFAVRYAQDATVDRLHRALEAGDAELAFRTVHSLRGLAQNLGFPRLYQAAAVLTEALRPRLLPVDPALIAAVDDAHRQVVAAIVAYSET